MPVGPLDPRRRQLRCVPCAASHLKCSFHFPCKNCERRSISCEYRDPRSNSALILVDSGKHGTVKRLSAQLHNLDHSRQGSRFAQPGSPPDDILRRYFLAFDTFAHRNQFAVGGSLMDHSVKALTGLHSHGHVLDAIVSVGALQTAKTMPPNSLIRKQIMSQALMFYYRALSGLRGALELSPTSPTNELRNSILWTTLIAGLFELIHEDTGGSWAQHMTHGTSKALEACGSSACLNKDTRAFFLQARIIEVCRSVLFNQTSFLATAEWIDLSQTVEFREADCTSAALNSILNIMVRCSKLCKSANEFVLGKADRSTTDREIYEAGLALSVQGWALRESLGDWYAKHVEVGNAPSLSAKWIGGRSVSPMVTSVTIGRQPDQLLAQAFFASTSIYLSGIFDYDIVHWQAFCILVPTLSENNIQQHLSNILHLAQAVLDETNLSPLLILICLRIGGARSREPWQRKWVTELLTKVSEKFAAASSLLFELAGLWSFEPVVFPDSSETSVTSM